jgi:DNA topoisomerase-1
VTVERQLATALYFIDRLALRAGNEKGEDEADTVGCCSLRYEHVTLQPPDKLVFDFLGKDSIRYYNVVDVEAQVFKNIRIFKGDGKTEGDAIFDRVTVSIVSRHSLAGDATGWLTCICLSPNRRLVSTNS